MKISTYSRWTREGRRRAYGLLAAAAVGMILLIFVGTPLLFSVAGTISSMRRPATIANNDLGPMPITPRFFEDLMATKAANLKIYGMADPNITIELFQNEFSQGTTLADGDGKFLFDADLNLGKNDFYAQAISPRGQKSDKSAIYTIVFVNKEPKLELKNITDNQTVKESPLKISGLTDTGSSVTINDRFVLVSSDGSFNYNLILNNGDNKIKVAATDPAGNLTTKEMTIKYSP